jgi:hypothetical protein
VDSAVVSFGWYTVVDDDINDEHDDDVKTGGGGGGKKEVVVRCYGLSDKHTTYGDASLVNAGLLCK